MLSTDISDCHDDLSGLCRMELDNLREWEAKFGFKYPMVRRMGCAAASVCTVWQWLAMA
jgi:hypothetical protein